jgi:hypothetical protein
LSFNFQALRLEPATPDLCRPYFSAPGVVDQGRTATCTVYVYDDSVPFSPPRDGVKVTWQIDPLASGRGTGTALLTCATPAGGWNPFVPNTLFAPGGSNCDTTQMSSTSPSTQQISCVTGQFGAPVGSGSCSIVYRRVPVAGGMGPGRESFLLTVTPPSGAAFQQGFPAALTVGNLPGTPNSDKTWLNCVAATPSDPNVAFGASTTDPRTQINNKTWTSTSNVTVTGSLGLIRCTANIADSFSGGADGTACIVTGPNFCGTWPDDHRSFPPMGQMQFEICDGSGTCNALEFAPGVPARCTLTTDASLTPVAANGGPSASSCVAQFALQLPNPLVPPASLDLRAAYLGPSHATDTSLPAASTGTSTPVRVPLQFN